MQLPQDPRRLAWWLFLKSHRAVLRVLEAELQSELGLSLTWYDVLAQLARAPRGHLLMHELADAIVISNSGLTRIVDRMQEAGLVRRRTAPGNRRAIEVRMTPAGEARYAQAAAVHERGIDEHFVRHLDRGEGERLLDALTRIHGAAEGA